MIKLQAAMGAGAILFVLLIIFLITGVPILTAILMKLMWRIAGKKDFIKNRKPYYKDPLIYFPVLICSIIIFTCVFYYLMIYMMSDIVFL